jgi:hypothetical protein
MTTSTKELAFELEVIAKVGIDKGTLHKISVSKMFYAAQRLRELDNPDCVWVNDDKRVDGYMTGCNKRQNVRWSPYCFNCGGAVKDVV